MSPVKFHPFSQPGSLPGSNTPLQPPLPFSWLYSSSKLLEQFGSALTYKTAISTLSDNDSASCWINNPGIGSNLSGYHLERKQYPWPMCGWVRANFWFYNACFNAENRHSISLTAFARRLLPKAGDHCKWQVSLSKLIKIKLKEFFTHIRMLPLRIIFPRIYLCNTKGIDHISCFQFPRVSMGRRCRI